MHKVIKFEMGSQDSQPSRAGQTLRLTAAMLPGLQGGQRPGGEGRESRTSPLYLGETQLRRLGMGPALPIHRPPLPRGPCAAPTAARRVPTCRGESGGEARGPARGA